MFTCPESLIAIGKIKKTFGLIVIAAVSQTLAICVNHHKAASQPATKIDTLAVLEPFITLVNLNKDTKQPDSILLKTIGNICKNEIKDVLTDKFYLVRNIDTTGSSLFKTELDSLSIIMDKKSKKELKQSPQSYLSMLNTVHQHVLLIQIDATYNDKYPPEISLQQSMMMGSLSGSPTLVIPIVRNKPAELSIRVFMFNSLNKKIVYFNQFQSNDDIRNILLI